MTEKRSFDRWEPMIAAGLVKEFEGLRLEAYLCPAGVPTIGYGHTHGVQLGTRISAEQADQLLTVDLGRVRRQLAPAVKVPVTRGQFIALLSLGFNVGDVGRKCPKLMAALNRGDVMTAAWEFLDVGLVKKRDAAGNVVYDEAGRTVYVQSKGLVRRRRREAEVFAS